MTELEKIGTLIDHWQEHNNEHAELYMDWAEKTSTLGRQELSRILTKLALESKRLNRLFQAAKNPFDIKKGQALPVQVLFEGKPLEGTTVKVLAYGKESATELITNKEGMADVIIEKPGIQIITARHKVPLKDNPDADNLSIGTALTFKTK